MKSQLAAGAAGSVITIAFLAFSSFQVSGVRAPVQTPSEDAKVAGRRVESLGEFYPALSNPSPLQVVVAGVPDADVQGRLPHPRNWVRFDDLTGYTVPAGKVLVITAFGGVGTVTPKLLFDGVPQYQAAGSGKIDAVPQGLFASAGTVITVTDASQGDGRVWGYLVEE